MQKISAVIITLNEEKNLGRTLSSLKWCDEIIILDSGSTDKTPQIAKEYGAKFFTHAFDGYGKQKQRAVALATNDWILSIDADEVVSEKLRLEIQQCLVAPQQIFGYYIPLQNVFMQQKIEYWGKASICHLRLFNRQFGTFDSAGVHERVELAGQTKFLASPLIHYSYRNLEHYFEKFNRYTSRAAQELFGRQKKIPCCLIFIRLPITFFNFYLVKGCFRFGLAGLTWSLLSAFYPVVKYLKLRELYYDSPASSHHS